MSNLLKVGAPAPDFELTVEPGNKLKLSELRGQPVVLVFYPADWSPVCGDQLGLYNAALDKLHPYKAQLVGISVDSEWCHAAYSDSRNLKFPLLADFEPKGAVSKLYQAYNDKRGASERVLYVIDAKGIIRWNYLSPEDVNPGMNGFLNALREIVGEKVSASHSDTIEEGDHCRGSQLAPITLVEYGDHQCPHCRKAHDEVKTVLDHFGLQVRYVFKNFPLVEIHPYAEIAAEAAESAAGLGNFWGMHDAIFAHQDHLQPENLLRYAATLGLNPEHMAADLKARRYLPRIKEDSESGIENGVNGTPSFFINGERYDGYPEAEALIEALSDVLNQQQKTPLQRQRR